jgi:hypothetical protein
MVRPTQSGPATPTDLLDRTGIIAASLPQRRRVDFGPEPAAAPVGRTSEAATATLCPKATDLRPREVVIRRRSRGWLAAGAGAVLVAAGWLGSGLFGVHSGGETVQADAQQNVAAIQPAPVVQQPPAPVEPPVVVVTPVPPARHVIHHAATPKPSAHPSKPSAPRADLPSASAAAAPSFDPVGDVTRQVQSIIAPLFQFMGTH